MSTSRKKHPRIVVLKLLVWGMICGGASVSPAFCLQTFNTFGPMYAPQIPQRTQSLAAEILKKPCELIHLQEVWNGSQQGQLVRALSPSLEVSAPNRKMKIGLMAFSQGQIRGESVQAFRLNSETWKDRLRGLVGVRKGFQNLNVRLEGLGTDLRATNVHTHPNSPFLRLTQILEIYQWRLLHQDLPWVVTGDFNFTADSFERSFFKALLGVQDVHEEFLGGYRKECTYCDENVLVEEGGDYLLDYIFVSNVSADMKWQWVTKDIAINMQGEPSQPLSDHYGLRAELDLVEALPNTEKIDFLARVKKHKEILQKAEAHLRKNNPGSFGPSIELLQRIQRQMDQQSGAAWDYFVKSQKRSANLL